VARSTPPPGDDDGSDDEALTWAGDAELGKEKPTDASRLVAYEMRDVSSAAVDDAPPVSAFGGVLAAVFGFVYLVLTIGWILGVQRTDAGTTDLVPQILWQFGEFTAIVAAPLWFGATLSLTRPHRAHSRAGARAGWLALGAGVLIPWPLLLGIVGQGGFS
jgi:hypothetical protein